jgi:hypothetical protein
LWPSAFAAIAQVAQRTALVQHHRRRLPRRLGLEHLDEGLFKAGVLLLDRSPAAAGRANPPLWMIGEVGIKFMPTTPDRLRVDARDPRYLALAAVATAFGLQAGEPAALLLVEAANEQVDLVVKRLFTALTRWAPTDVDLGGGHGTTSRPCGLRLHGRAHPRGRKHGSE